MVHELRRRGKDIQEQETENKIKEGRYNVWYKRKTKEGLPEYMDESRSLKEIRTKARIRCGNMESKNRYWQKEEKRRCMLCDEKEGTFEHYVSECRVSIERFDEIDGEEREKVIKSRDKKKERKITEIWRKVEEEYKKIQKKPKNKTNRKLKQEGAKKEEENRKGKRQKGISK